jgi:PilZ domain-containing protein
MNATTQQEEFSVDLRQHPRLRVAAPFACSLSRRGLAKWLGRKADGIGVVFDVSMRGAKVMSEAGIQPGDRLSMRLSLPNQASPMAVEEATVRWEKDQVYGLEFNDLSPVAEMRLRKFITISTKPPT